MNTKISANLFDIQSYSIHDGPGCRTTLFFSGCPLTCLWCCNPEGMTSHSKLMFTESKCTECGRCLAACSEHKTLIEGDRDCHSNMSCGENPACVDHCYKEALSVSGFKFSLQDLEKLIKRDRDFWGEEGGLTFSGGEPLVQREFLKEALKLCKQQNVHCALETSLFVPTLVVEEMLPSFDFIFIDLKHMDSSKHKEFTGQGNELILKNFELLKNNPDLSHKVVVRLPLIPDFNIDENNIRRSISFLKDMGLRQVNLLPFHPYALSKYQKLKKTYAYANHLSTHLDKEFILSFFHKEPLLVYWGDETPF